MKIFKDNFKPELIKGRGFLATKPKEKGKYEVTITRTPNGVYRYKTEVRLSGKKLGSDWDSHGTETKLGGMFEARKIIKEYEKSLKKDKVVHKLYI